jgi:hypothetical protein
VAVAARAVRGDECPGDGRCGPPGASARVMPDPRGNHLWAELLQRTFGFDVRPCPRCGDRLRLIALIEDPRVVRRILAIWACRPRCRRRTARARRHCLGSAATRPRPRCHNLRRPPTRRSRGTTPTSTLPDRRPVVE